MFKKEEETHKKSSKPLSKEKKSFKKEPEDKDKYGKKELKNRNKGARK